MTCGLTGMRKSQVPRANDMPCHMCGKDYSSPMKKNGRRWTMTIDGIKYTGTPYRSTCPHCKTNNDISFMEKKK